MTEYIPVDLQHVSRGQWRAYVPSLGLFVHGSSENDIKYGVWGEIEEATGTHDFRITWREC